MDESHERYRVVENDEGYRSLWPLERGLPAGWQEAGHEGTRASCLQFVEETWKDMRPRSIRARRNQP